MCTRVHSTAGMDCWHGLLLQCRYYMCMQYSIPVLENIAIWIHTDIGSSQSDTKNKTRVPHASYYMKLACMVQQPTAWVRYVYSSTVMTVVRRAAVGVDYCPSRHPGNIVIQCNCAQDPGGHFASQQYTMEYGPIQHASGMAIPVLEYRYIRYYIVR